MPEDHPTKPPRRQPRKTLYLERGNKREHVFIAERALGKPLPSGAEVHHVNEDKWDNRPCNLVICQDAAYHRLLHVRQRVLAAGGNPNTQRVCSACGLPKAIEDFQMRSTGKRVTTCRPCSRLQLKAWKARNPQRARELKRLSAWRCRARRKAAVA